MAGSRGDIQAGRAFVTLFLKNTMTRQLTGVINQARAGLKQFASIARPIGMALSKIGVAIGASYIALASGNALVVQKAQLIHKTLANAIAPAVLPILDRSLAIAQAFASWASHNKGILTSILRIGLGMAAVGTALKLSALAARGLAAALLVCNIAATSFATLINSTWLVPLGAVLVTLVAIGAAVYLWSPTFRHFFNQNLADWEIWFRNVMGIFKSISIAIADGRFELAWRIVLAGMELEGARFSVKFIQTFVGAFVKVVEALEIFETAFKVGLLGLGMEAAKLGGVITKSLTDAFTPLLQSLSQFIPQLKKPLDMLIGLSSGAQATAAVAISKMRAEILKAAGEGVPALKPLLNTLRGLGVAAEAVAGIGIPAMMKELEKLRVEADKRQRTSE